MCWKCDGTEPAAWMVAQYDQFMASAMNGFDQIVDTYRTHRADGVGDIESLTNLAVELVHVDKETVASLLIGAIVRAAGHDCNEVSL